MRPLPRNGISLRHNGRARWVSARYDTTAGAPSERHESGGEADTPWREPAVGSARFPERPRGERTVNHGRVGHRRRLRRSEQAAARGVRCWPAPLLQSGAPSEILGTLRKLPHAARPLALFVFPRSDPPGSMLCGEIYVPSFRPCGMRLRRGPQADS